MSSVDLMKSWKEDNPQVENIVLFISDALRWDYAPKSVLSRGVTFKTVASGTFTPVSIPSIVTGLYPQHHRVHSFRDRLPKGTSNLLSLQGYNTSLYTENTWIDYDPPESSAFYKFLNHRNRISLKELEPPFVYMEDEKGGHCPYGWSFANKEYAEWDCQSFFRDYGKKRKEMLRQRYQKGIERSARVFESRMRVIDERGLADDTLVIFLSDHGELLGEYGGIVGHQILTAPEVVYVPTIFIHSDLPRGKSFDKEGVLRHVDLYPTICDLVGKKAINEVDGVNLFSAEKLPDFGFTYYLERMEEGRWIKSLLSHELKEKSVWDKDGGYLFREGLSPLLLLLRAIYVTTLCKSTGPAIYQRERMKKTKLLDTLKDYRTLLRCFCSTPMKYGSPSFSLEEAHDLIANSEREGVWNDRVPLPISRSLYNELKCHVELSQGEFKSVEEYVKFVLEKALMEKSKPQQAYSPEEKQKAKERLKNLGYL